MEHGSIAEATAFNPADNNHLVGRGIFTVRYELNFCA
jgi:hypothetical protein